MIKHVEDTLKPKENVMAAMLPTIQEDQEDDETELNNSYLYEGFDEDGNRITEDE